MENFIKKNETGKLINAERVFFERHGRRNRVLGSEITETRAEPQQNYSKFWVYFLTLISGLLQRRKRTLRGAVGLILRGLNPIQGHRGKPAAFCRKASGIPSAKG